MRALTTESYARNSCSAFTTIVVAGIIIRICLSALKALNSRIFLCSLKIQRAEKGPTFPAGKLKDSKSVTSHLLDMGTSTTDVARQARHHHKDHQS